MLAILLTACSVQTAQPSSSPTQVVDEIVFYDWADDYIADVFEQFTDETGIRVKYVTYESQEEAVENMRRGEVYDVVVMENQFIPGLVADGLLAEIDFGKVPNFKNIAPQFRDLVHDPSNRHTIPNSWGTTGLVVRGDMIDQPVTRWADLWDERFANQVVLWESTPRYTMGMALKVLGYSVNSENPVELEQAKDLLLQLKPRAIWLDEEASSAPQLLNGEAVVALGWSFDLWEAQKDNESIFFVNPEEGGILWGDNFIIPANSPRKQAAERFLNFILRSEVSGQIINANYYPMANEAAEEFVTEEILNDPVIYPPNSDQDKSEILLPLSIEGQAKFDEIWAELLAGN